MAAKKTPSRSDFIRSQPTSVSAADVVKKGKAQGIKFSPQLVYNVRRGSKATKGKATKTERATTSAAHKSPATKVEDLLRAVAAEIGLGRAIDLLQADRARVQAVLRS
jgi:hypothetical protein